MQKSNIETLKTNMALCRTDKDLAEAIETGRVSQFIVEGNVRLQVSTAQYHDPAEVILVNERTFASVKDIDSERVAVLNFASAFHPGGGVENGANAQEECLCRTSTLYPCLVAPYPRERFYEKHKKERRKMSAFGTDDILYTPRVITTMSDEEVPQILPKEERRVRNVITCAAPNIAEHKPKDKFSFEILFRKAMKNRIRRIFKVAMQTGNDVLVVGAFGCGAFGCDPKLVSEIMAEVTIKFMCRFKKIVWAVYDPSKEQANFNAFSDAYNKVTKEIESYEKWLGEKERSEKESSSAK